MKVFGLPSTLEVRVWENGLPGSNELHILSTLTDADTGTLNVITQRPDVAAQCLPPGRVAMPRDADEAAAMMRLGEAWLQQNAPERLKQAEPTVDATLPGDLRAYATEWPHPGTDDVAKVIDAMLAKYGWPSNPRNAARAGYRAAQQIVQGRKFTGSSASAHAADGLRNGTKLWLWRNGKDTFVAYDNEWPCYSPGGDPMTLGEPAATAEFRSSYTRDGKGSQPTALTSERDLTTAVRHVMEYHGYGAPVDNVTTDIVNAVLRCLPFEQPDPMANRPYEGAGVIDPDEADAGRLWAEIHKLRAALVGPEGYASWQDAAVAERRRRVLAERQVPEVKVHVMDGDTCRSTVHVAPQAVQRGADGKLDVTVASYHLPTCGSDERLDIESEGGTYD